MTYRMDSTVDVDRTRRQIVEEFRKWKPGGSTYAASEITDHEFPLRMDRKETKASVRFVLRGMPVVVECDSQWEFRDNLRCIFYAVQGMRMNEVRGIADTMQNAYLQLAAPDTGRDPYEVLGVRPDTELADIEAIYRSKAKRMHSDVGGDDAAMKELNDALERIKVERDGV